MSKGCKWDFVTCSLSRLDPVNGASAVSPSKNVGSLFLLVSLFVDYFGSACSIKHADSPLFWQKCFLFYCDENAHWETYFAVLSTSLRNSWLQVTNFATKFFIAVDMWRNCLKAFKNRIWKPVYLFTAVAILGSLNQVLPGSRYWCWHVDGLRRWPQAYPSSSILIVVDTSYTFLASLLRID